MSTIGDIFLNDPTLIALASQSKAAVDASTVAQNQITNIQTNITNLNAQVTIVTQLISDTSTAFAARITTFVQSGSPSSDINDDSQCRDYTVTIRQSQTYLVTLNADIVGQTANLGQAQSDSASIAAQLITLRNQTIARMDQLRG